MKGPGEAGLPQTKAAYSWPMAVTIASHPLLGVQCFSVKATKILLHGFTVSLRPK